MSVASLPPAPASGTPGDSDSENSDPVFEAVSLTRTFRSASGAEIRALVDVSWAVPRRAFATITGPSGSGKTTLLALIGALDRPTSGRVLFDGLDLGRATEAERCRQRRRMGLVFQRSPMIHGLPLWENITLALVPLGVPAEKRRQMGLELLDHVGLAERLESQPRELSGGELRRAGIARALATQPDVLLADEPTQDLDIEGANAVAGLLREFHARGKTVVVVTHDESLDALASVRCHIRNGRRES